MGCLVPDLFPLCSWGLQAAAATPQCGQEPSAGGSNAHSLPWPRGQAQAILSGQSRAGHWPRQDELCNLLLRGFSISFCSVFTIHSLPTAGQKPLNTDPEQPFLVTSGSGIMPLHLSPSGTLTFHGLFSMMEQPTTRQKTCHPPSQVKWYSQLKGFYLFCSSKGTIPVRRGAGYQRLLIGGHSSSALSGIPVMLLPLLAFEKAKAKETKGKSLPFLHPHL